MVLGHEFCSMPSMMIRASSLSGSWTVGCFALATFGCSQSEDLREQGPGDTSFISHIPGAAQGDSNVDDGATTGDTGSTSGSGGSSSAPSDEDGDQDAPERLIAEADIIKVDGARLYALSRYSGLSVIDIENPKDLRLLGSHRASATPFEMYVEGERAYVMYNGWGQYSFNAQEGYWGWKTTSRIQALDLSDPAAIAVLGEHDMPGELSDSRKVGDVLYLVTYENGYCWECDVTANTRVTSFNVEDPDAFVAIDEERILEVGSYGGRRSIAVTPERIYISGWDWTGTSGGAIDIIDIADPAGKLTRGATFDIAGPIESRWQMDEFEGTLRVISQPGGWGNGAAPVVQTFQVVSSTEIKALASLDVVLPRPEDLRSVRFDGDRAYAITFEQTDPLFTFDLSDPLLPRQVGELEIPGWVYHMEPRGDRIYALGYDNADSEGSLHVSLFDVSELSAPQQIARVNFGGSWAQFAEDQDRIHKAFNILEDDGLILVPYAGWDYEGDGYCGGQYHSGIQLVDMTRDALTLRGVAPQVGEARRGILLEDTLIGVSDNAVQTFDIEDRDAPTMLDTLEVARNITSLRVLDDVVLRFGSDWWTGRAALDVTSFDAAQGATPLGDVDLSTLAPNGSDCTSQSYWENQVFVQGDYAYVPLRVQRWDDGSGNGENSQELTIFVIDVSDRTAPRVIDRVVTKTTNENEWLTGVTKTDSALLVGRRKTALDSQTGNYQSSFVYDVFSLSDPALPALVSSFEVPGYMTGGGFGQNVSGCAIDVGWGWWGYGYYGYGYNSQTLVSGDMLVSQHQVPLNDNTGRVRYYLDRIDVSNPSEPRVLDSINIPGGVVDFNEKTGRIVTVDYDYEELKASSWEECPDGAWDGNLCRNYRRALNTLHLEDDVATLVDHTVIDRDTLWASSIAISKDRVFASYAATSDEESHVRVFKLDNQGQIATLGDVTTSESAWGTLYARDDRAFFVSSGLLTVIDTSDVDDLTKKVHEMNGYSCSALEVADDYAYCALGAQGVQAFALD